MQHIVPAKQESSDVKDSYGEKSERNDYRLPATSPHSLQLLPLCGREEPSTKTGGYNPPPDLTLHVPLSVLYLTDGQTDQSIQLPISIDCDCREDGQTDQSIQLPISIDCDCREITQLKSRLLTAAGIWRGPPSGLGCLVLPNRSRMVELGSDKPTTGCKLEKLDCSQAFSKKKICFLATVCVRIILYKAVREIRYDVTKVDSTGKNVSAFLPVMPLSVTNGDERKDLTLSDIPACPSTSAYIQSSQDCLQQAVSQQARYIRFVDDL
ncbi:hypothetical protein RRG08_045118 [Elysia crispata]|uniref:Uncharacterized protein n=1 Tax=Elysia crispata TaxID=231223 RepID=A0AAE0YTQ2_9GAST|nr:hypothetical protein RRG08_045118 [Elysia crispata]